MSYLLLFFFARSGIIKPSDIKTIGVIMFIAVWNGLPGVVHSSDTSECSKEETPRS